MSQKPASSIIYKLVIVLVVTIFLVVLAGLLLPSLAWTGGAGVTFRFQIYSKPGLYVTGAKVRVIRSIQLESLSSPDFMNYLPFVTTDTNGCAEMRVMCGAGGGSGLFGKNGHWVVSHELLVEAPGYRPISVPLETVLGGNRFPLSKRSVDVKLVMFKQPALKN